MAIDIILRRSATASKRPETTTIQYGELALDYNNADGGLYYKSSTNAIIKVGSAFVGTTAPNATPAGSAGNSLGEFWLDTTGDVLKIWNGSTWTSISGGGITSITAGAGLTGGTITTSGTIALDTTQVIQPSILTAKGNLIAASAASTPVALAVGGNGQLLAANSASASGLEWITASGTGTVTGVTAGTGLSGGTITTSGTIDLANTAVTPGSYTNSSFTVDAQGRLTAASSGTTPVTSVSATGPITSSGGATPVISTSVATNKLLGRSTAGTGVAEEIGIGTNLTLSAGTLSAPAFATVDEMKGVATTATATSGATTITVASGTGISNDDSVYGVGIVPGTTVVSGGGTTSIVLDTAIVNTLSATPVTFNTNQTIVTPGDTGAGLAKAWVRWNPAAGTWPGGTSTVFRANLSTTATITTTNNHGLSVGSRVYAATGVTQVANGYVVVSVPTPKTFTITTASSTLLNNVAITFYVSTILSSYNIHSIVPSLGTATSTSWYFNFATPMLNSNYITLGTGNLNDGAPVIAGAGSQTQAAVNIFTYVGGTATAPDSVNALLVFG